MGTPPSISSYKLMQKIGRFVFKAPGLFACQFDKATEQNEFARVLDYLNGVSLCEGEFFGSFNALIHPLMTGTRVRHHVAELCDRGHLCMLGKRYCLYPPRLVESIERWISHQKRAVEEDSHNQKAYSDICQWRLLSPYTRQFVNDFRDEFYAATAQEDEFDADTEQEGAA